MPTSIIRPISLPVPHRALLALVVGAIGCGGAGQKCKPPEYDGLYVKCDGGKDGLYWITNVGNVDYLATLCLDERFVNETGVGGTEGDYDLSEWIHDTEDIESLQAMCVAACEEQTNIGGHCSGNGLKWDVQNYKGFRSQIFS